MNAYQFQTALEIFSTVPAAQHTRYPKHYYIYLPNDLSRYVYILTRGAVKIGGYASSGHEVMFDCIFPSEFFGNLQYLEGDFFTEFAKTLTPTEVLEVPVQSFKNMVRDSELVATWFHEISTLRWWRAEDRLFKIASEKPIVRIQHILPMLRQQITDADDQKHILRQLLSYQDIADLSGLSRQSAARILKSIFSESKSKDVKLS